MTSNGNTRSRVDIEGSDHAKAAGRDYYEGITFEQHQQALREREAAVRQDLAEKQAERDRANAAERRVLEMEIGQLQQKLSEYELRLRNPEQSYSELQQRIEQLEGLLDQQSHQIGENRLKAAHAALRDGVFSLANEIFQDVERNAMEHAAEAAFGQGLIAEDFRAFLGLCTEPGALEQA
ncbi:MAG: hypothetical protein AAGI70_10025 [Pseudomonadota bacterium]